MAHFVFYDLPQHTKDEIIDLRAETEAFGAGGPEEQAPAQAEGEAVPFPGTAGSKSDWG